MTWANMVRPAFMHHCFAADVRTNNGVEFQIVPGMSGRIIMMYNRLRDFSKK
jgi:hypothetical protein